MSPSLPSIRIGSIVVLLILAATAPATMTAVGAPSTAETIDSTTGPTVGNLSATLPPRGTDPSEIRTAAESNQLVPTDAVHPNGTVVFRLNGSVTAASSNDSSLGDGLQFSMQQTARSTTPERLPLRVNTSRSGDAIRTFTVDTNRYVVVNLADATWEYDGEPGTHALEPRPRVDQEYVATLTTTSNNTTRSQNTTIRVTEPEIAADAAVDAGSVAELNVSMPGTWTATVVVGNESVGYRAALRVVDEDADGMVSVRVDTDAVEPDEVFSAVGPDTAHPHPAAEGFTKWNATLQPGAYRLGAGVEDPITVAADRHDWGPVLTVVDATPAESTSTLTASPTATPSTMPIKTTTRSATPAPTTTESRGFGSMIALLSLTLVAVVALGRRTDP